MTSVIGVGANGAQGRTERAPRHAQTQPTCPVDHGVHHLLGLLSVRVRDALSGDVPPAREEASCQAVRRGEANPPPPALFPLALLNRCRVGPVVQVGHTFRDGGVHLAQAPTQMLAGARAAANPNQAVLLLARGEKSLPLAPECPGARVLGAGCQGAGVGGLLPAPGLAWPWLPQMGVLG